MEDKILFSISADVFCLVLCVIAIIVVQLWRQALGRGCRLLCGAFLAHAVQVISNMVGLIFKGGTAPYVRSVLLVSNFAEFASGYVLSLLMTFYIIAILERSKDLFRWKKAVAVLCAVSLALLVLSQFNGMYYVIDADNYYRRGPLYPLSLAVAAVEIMIDASLVIRYRARLTRAEKLAVWTYLVLPIGALAIQPLIYGVYLVLLMDTLAMIIMSLILLYVQTRRYYDQELELAESRLELTRSQTAIMLSQIQPHFLYNVLAAIDQLCRENPARASEAVCFFSTYLRGNFRALTQNGLVTIQEEMKHVMAYLKLEQMRYEELLTVDCPEVDPVFLLPVLSVQPLVENAVKHGLSDKREGGTVTIRCTVTEAAYIVTIKDDGLGFSPGEVKGDGEHSGIENIRRRLAVLCGGTLMVESEPGRGTKATITIPKGEERNEDTCSG